MTRREMVKLAGMALIGIRQVPGVSKAVYLPPAGSLDPVAHSLAENLFWSDIMTEHAGFFMMLMPGPELAAYRTEAETFQRSFQNQITRARSAKLDTGNYAALNKSTIELLKHFAEYKQKMLDAQNSRKIRTLVFSLFFDHTAREAQRAAARLEKLAGGDVSVNSTEVIDFWSAIMSDHSEFIAHLLDPQEEDLIGQAFDASAVFKGIKAGNQKRQPAGSQILLAGEELIDYEAALNEGIEAGTIKSIIYPSFLDHARRETLKFLEELRRSANKT